MHDFAESDTSNKFAESNTSNVSRESDASDISETFELFDSVEFDTSADSSESDDSDRYSISAEFVSNDSAASDMLVNYDEYNIYDVADTTHEYDISVVSDLSVFNASDVSDDCSDSDKLLEFATSDVSVLLESNDFDESDCCAAAISTDVASD